jgi:cytosine/adenosine deaminase-related metal-dependent hydrolase
MATTDEPARRLLLRGGTVLTLDEHATVIPGADLVLEGGYIREVSTSIVAPTGARVIDVSGHLVLPGLVQGHVHLGQTIFRGLAEGRRLLPWLRERIWPLEAGHDDESAYWCSLLGAAECLLGGTTTIQDIGIGPGAPGLVAAFFDSGLRGLLGQCLMDGGEGLPAGLRGSADDVLASCERLGAEIEQRGDGKVRPVLNPRFILSCSDDLWRGIEALSSRHGWPVHTHALEQEEESAAVASLKGGRGEIEYFDDTGILASDLRIAHGVWLEETLWPRLSGERFSVVHCPSSNLKLGSGVADVVGMRNAGIPVGVGADGTPCNNDLDALEELRLAALLQQLKNGPGSFPGVDALRLATSDGARAIGMGDEIGSIEVGKAADVVVLALDRPELWTPVHADLHDLVVYGASRASVRHVFVSGEQLVEDGRLTKLDVAEIHRRATSTLAGVLARSGIDL